MKNSLIQGVKVLKRPGEKEYLDADLAIKDKMRCLVKALDDYPNSNAIQ